MSAVLDDPFGSAPVLAPAKPRKTADPAPAPYFEPIAFTIHGEPGSKANSRKPMMLGRGEKARVQFVKSDKAYAYEQAALKQIPPKYRLQLACLVKVTLRIFYASERPDLDESIVLDVLQNRYKTVDIPGGGKQRLLLQAGVYVNDRQVREKHVFHGIDKLMPRTEVVIESLSPQETLL